jgi:hypothetical protein
LFELIRFAENDDKKLFHLRVCRLAIRSTNTASPNLRGRRETLFRSFSIQFINTPPVQKLLASCLLISSSTLTANHKIESFSGKRICA